MTDFHLGVMRVRAAITEAKKAPVAMNVAWSDVEEAYKFWAQRFKKRLADERAKGAP